MIIERIWAIFWAIIILLLISSEYKRTREFITPWTIFLGLSLFDIYLPVILLPDAGFSTLPPWISPGISNGVLPALLLYSSGILLYGGGYSWIQRRSRRKQNGLPSVSQRVFSPTSSKLTVNTRRVRSVLVISSTWYVMTLVYQWNSAGSITSWLSDHLLNRFQGTAVLYASPITQLFLQVGEQMRVVSILCIIVMFALRQSGGNRIMRTWVLPLFGLVISTTTFFRGTQLAYLAGLAIIEVLRSKNPQIQSENTNSLMLKRMRKRAVLLVILAVLVFIAYGSLRNFLIDRQRGYSDAALSQGVSFELSRVVRGEGLRGVVAIVEFYPRVTAFLHGKTLIDMTLLPIPRLIWKTKPLWYGIDDITRRMGWPASTQSAVTMPGELYANFGYPGVLLMFVYGLIFGTIARHRFNLRWMFVYAVWMPSTVMTTFWMAYTGFMNSLIRLPLLLILVWYIVPQISAQKIRLRVRYRHPGYRPMAEADDITAGR